MLLADEAETGAFGRQLAGLVVTGDVVSLSGPLGAGKTALARGLIAGLGFDGEVPSPSFALAIAYQPPDVRIAVTHVDLYRVDDAAAVEQLALDEAAHEGILIVEWPDLLPARIVRDALHLTLAIEPDDARCLTAVVPAGWTSRWRFR